MRKGGRKGSRKRGRLSLCHPPPLPFSLSLSPVLSSSPPSSPLRPQRLAEVKVGDDTAYSSPRFLCFPSLSLPLSPHITFTDLILFPPLHISPFTFSSSPFMNIQPLLCLSLLTHSFSLSSLLHFLNWSRKHPHNIIFYFFLLCLAPTHSPRPLYSHVSPPSLVSFPLCFLNENILPLVFPPSPTHNLFRLPHVT